MWLTLLKQACDQTSMTEVAEKLDISRTTISLVISGKYPAKTDKIETKVLNVYGKVSCPFLGVEITQTECKKHHTNMAPTSSPRAMKHWRACLTCPHSKSNKEGIQHDTRR